MAESRLQHARVAKVGHQLLEVGLVVDLNERKHGRHVPGAGQPIQPPEAVSRHRPDVVLAMNPLYVEEIGGTLRKLGVTADVVPV